MNFSMSAAACSMLVSCPLSAVQFFDPAVFSRAALYSGIRYRRPVYCEPKSKMKSNANKYVSLSNSEIDKM